MSAHAWRAIGDKVVQERRVGMEMERSTFDLAAARKLRDQIEAAIADAEAAR